MNLPSPAHFHNQRADARVTEAQVPRHFTGGFRAVPQALQDSVLILGAECVHAGILGKRGETGKGRPVIVTVTDGSGLRGLGVMYSFWGQDCFRWLWFFLDCGTL